MPELSKNKHIDCSEEAVCSFSDYFVGASGGWFSGGDGGGLGGAQRIIALLSVQGQLSLKIACVCLLCGALCSSLFANERRECSPAHLTSVRTRTNACSQKHAHTCKAKSPF